MAGCVRKTPWPSYGLPADLVVLAGHYGIELQLSCYESGSQRDAERREDR
jgi:hypothetical protein